MKRRNQATSVILILTMVLTMFAAMAPGVFAAEAGTLPPTLPGETVYKWGYYTASGATKPAMHYHSKALGTVDQSSAMPEALIGAEYTVSPLATVADMKAAKNATPDDEGAYVKYGGGLAKITTFSGDAVKANAAGLMLRVKNLLNSEYGGLDFSIKVNGTTYYPAPSGNYPQCFCHVYYYDYGEGVWYAEEFEQASNLRLAPNYDGYLYMPINTFYAVTSDKTQLTAKMLQTYGISEIDVSYSWTPDTGAIIRELDVVYSEGYVTDDPDLPPEEPREAGSLPPTLPGKTVYKWGYYTASGATKPAMHYRSKALGKVDQARAMPAEQIGAIYTVRPIATAADMKKATNTKPDEAGALIEYGAGTAKITSFSGGTIFPGAAGLMLHVKNLLNSEYGGLDFSIKVNGKTYYPAPSGNYPECFCHVYYYDEKDGAWYAEEFEQASNFRLAPNYDGYIYMPLNTFYALSAGKPQLTAEELSAYGISEIDVLYSWTPDTGAILMGLDAVYTLPYATFLSVTPSVGNDLSLTFSATVLTAEEPESVTAELRRDGAEPELLTGVPGEEAGVYTFRSSGFGFTHLGDTFDLALSVDGEELAVLEDYSLRRYAEALLRAGTGAETFAADLLNLGAVEQQLKGYNVRDLATANLTDAEKARISAMPEKTAIPTVKSFTAGSDSSVQFLNCTLYNGEWLSMQVNFDAESVEGLTVTATAGGKTYTYDKFYPIGEHYAFVFDHINPMDLSEPVTFTFDRANTGTMTYSFGDVLRNGVGGKNNGLKKLSGAIWNFYNGAKRCGGVLVLAKDGKSDFVLVGVDRPSDAELELLTAGSAAIRSLTGAKVLYGTESEVLLDTEIVFAATDRREDAARLMAETSYTGYRVEISGNRIILAAYDPELLSEAFDNLMKAVRRQGDSWVLPSYYTDSRELGDAAHKIPRFATEGRVNAGYSLNNGNVGANVSGTNADEVRAYVEELLANGYTQYASNVIGENLFFTLTKAGSATLHVNYYEEKNRCKLLACTEGQYEPATVAEPFTPVSGLTPYVLQAHHAGTSHDAGMTYILQLSDGSYIVIDGGTWESGVNDADLENTYQYLRDHNPNGGKPVISCWMITHADGDHMQLATAFMKRYGGVVDLRTVAYNFPDYEKIPMDWTYSNQDTAAFVGAVKNGFPNAKHWILHAGQKQTFADAEIEVLFTWEDYYPDRIVEMNTTSSTWKITIGGVSFLVCGDSDDAMLQFMADVYGDALACDIVQAAHHGNNDKCPDYYAAANAKICLWTNKESEMTRILGKHQSKMDHFPLCGKWTRGEETGDVVNYHHDVDTVVYFDRDLTVSVGK